MKRAKTSLKTGLVTTIVICWLVPIVIVVTLMGVLLGRSYQQSAQREIRADMESAAAAHVCYVNRTPFLSVRTITDTREQDGTASFEENCAQAAQLSAEFVREMLRLI